MATTGWGSVQLVLHSVEERLAGERPKLWRVQLRGGWARRKDFFGECLSLYAIITALNECLQLWNWAFGGPFQHPFLVVVRCWVVVIVAWAWFSGWFGGGEFFRPFPADGGFQFFRR